MLRFRLFGVPFGIGFDFWIGSALLGGGFAQGKDASTNLLIWIACVLVSITVHELGHALTARRFGADPEIELHAFGGFTRMPGRLLSRPEDFWVTLAGPAAGIGLYLLTVVARNWPGLIAGLVVSDGAAAAAALKALGFLTRINLVWTLFNLLPILPLDGGRLLNALLGGRRIQLTQTVGVFFAASLAVLAAMYQQLFMALFLGYLAFVNFRGNPRAVPGGVSQQ